MQDDTQFYGNFNDSKQQQFSSKENKATNIGYSIARVFGYMFMFLLVTTVISFGLALLFNYLFLNAGSAEEQANLLLVAIVGSIISGVVLIVLSIVNQFIVLRGKHAITVPAIIYSSVMGVVMGFLTGIIVSFYENGWLIIALSFGVTTLIFGLMALVALLSKSKLNALPIVAMGLFFGLMMMSGVMFLLMLFLPGFQNWYWILSLGLFAVVMLMTIWDIRNIKTLAERGALTRNLSMYIAFSLYTDFMYILLRILSLILRIMGRGKN